MVDSDGDERGDVERLLSELIVELGRREAVVAGLESDLRRCEEQLAEISPENGVRRGDTQRLIAAEQLRRRLRSEGKSLRKRLAEAVADVNRARERRAVLEEELGRGRAPGDVD